MLSGHTDVVPVDGQPGAFRLSASPSVMAATMAAAARYEGFLACVLAAVDDFLAAPLRMPLHLAFSYDEEVGCLGVRSPWIFCRPAGETGAVPHRRADRDAAGVRS